MSSQEKLFKKNEIKEVKTFQGRLSDCHNALTIKVIFNDSNCQIFCEVCGKACGFYRIKQI